MSQVDGIKITILYFLVKMTILYFLLKLSIHNILYVVLQEKDQGSILGGIVFWILALRIGDGLGGVTLEI